jgi:NTP pyrophosphatase (non-canonical NTP hydrolase)
VSDETKPEKGLNIEWFQKHIAGKYEAHDRERGTPKTWMNFTEEVGELARALYKNDRPNIEEEMADIFAWLCSLANINDIDLAKAIEKKYLSKDAPTGQK